MNKLFPLMALLGWGIANLLGASGQPEFTDQVQNPSGETVDELTPILRTYALAGMLHSLEVSGPLELEILSGTQPGLTLTAHSGLLYQSLVTLREGHLQILLEPGLTGPLEKGRLKVRLITGPLELVRLRRGAVCTVDLQQTQPLVLEIRDQVYLKGSLRTPLLRGLLSWKSEARIAGEVGSQIWNLQGLSTLRIPDLIWGELDVNAQDSSQIFTRHAGKVKGTLRSRSLLEIPPGADLESLLLREESRVQEPPAIP